MAIPPTDAPAIENADPHGDSAPVGRRERRKRELRERIYQTASLLFLKQGFAATTVEQIAETADIAPATFFNHFPGKDAVLREMSAEVITLVTTLVEEQRKRQVSTPAALQDMAARFSQVIAATQGFAREVLIELMGHSVRPGEAGPLLSRVRESFAALVVDGQTRGDVREDQSADFLADMIVGVFYGTVTQWVNDPTYPFSERLGHSAAFLAEALAPRRR